VTCCGRLFQTRAAATGKARSPTVESRVRRTISDEDETEISWSKEFVEPVPKPGNTDGCGRKGNWLKNSYGCMAVLTLTLCCRPASGHTVTAISQAGRAINQWPYQIQN